MNGFDHDVDMTDQSHMNAGEDVPSFIDPRELQRSPVHESESEMATTVSGQSSSNDVAVYPSLRKGYLPTGCCYDDRMKFHADSDWADVEHHPEDPRRIEVIMLALKQAGLVYSGPDFDLIKMLRDSPNRFMYRIDARPATKAEICTAHASKHYDWVERLSEMSPPDLRELSRELNNGRKSVYVCNLTFEAALLSAGGAIETCKNVVAGTVKNALAIIRPPGHHAEHDEPLGFCLFNNVAVAAKICQEEYRETCRKILILDWDVHHGNGIQNIFYEDPNVVYVSIHVYKNNGELFYPGKATGEKAGEPDGSITNCGTGPGIGKNVNIGWPSVGMGDGEYMAAFQKIVMPIAQEFDPDLVIISAGFDAAAGDPLGECYVTPPCYAHMTHMLMSLAGGKVAVCLEGGYKLEAISKSALAVAKTLMGEPPDRLTIPSIDEKAARMMDHVRRIQAPYWQCMRPGPLDMSNIRSPGAVRLHEVIRDYQRQQLWDQHKMLPLYIQRDKLSRCFENQVLATQTLAKSKRILFIIHEA